MYFSRYDGSTKEASFSIGLQGIAEEDTERVKQLISQTIDGIIEYAAFMTLKYLIIIETQRPSATHKHQIYISSPHFFFWLFLLTGMGLRRNKSKLSSIRSKSR